jgi:soluble lytic murein transglycosylase-like protein
MIPDVISSPAKLDTSAKSKALDEKAKLKLQKAVQDFEAIFVNYLLQNMRKTVQKSDDESSDFGGDMMQGMFDLEIAKHVSKNGSLGMGAMLYKQLTGESIPQRSPRPVIATPITLPDHVKVSMPPPDTTAKSLPKKLDQLQNMINNASSKYDVDPNLIKAVIAAESAGNPRAISPKSAKGLMQLIDSTATAMGVKDVWNPQQNILGGSKYLKQLLDRFDGNVRLAVASYNAGPQAVEKHQGVPPYPETNQYVNRVMKYMRLFEQQGSAE